MSFPARGDVIVVMTNGPGGFVLMGDINRTAADVYGWPALPLIIRQRMALSAEEREHLPGQYVDPRTGEPTLDVSIDEGGRVVLSTTQPATSIWSHQRHIRASKDWAEHLHQYALCERTDRSTDSRRPRLDRAQRDRAQKDDGVSGDAAPACASGRRS